MIDNELFAAIQERHKGLWTSFSMGTSELRFLLAQIYTKEFTNIIEFGSGLSTVYIADLIKRYSITAKLTSVESDPHWLDKVQKYAHESDLSSHINFIYAPVFPDSRMGVHNKWYSESILEESLADSPLFDMVIVDGPIAYYSEIERSRYGAMPFMISRISKDCTFILDDCNRQGEQAVLDLWKREFGMSFHILNGRMGVHQPR